MSDHPNEGIRAVLETLYHYKSYPQDATRRADRGKREISRMYDYLIKAVR